MNGISIIHIAFLSTNLASGGIFSDSPCLVIFLIIVIVVSIWGFISSINQNQKAQQKKKEDRQKRENSYNASISRYDNAKKYVDIPNDAKLVKLTKKGTAFGLPEGNAFLWKKENELQFFPDTPRQSNANLYLSGPIRVLSIPIKDIEYFKVKGEVFRETKISGGGGGGSSIKGAVAGSLIAGDTGAVIGSRKKN